MIRAAARDSRDARSGFAAQYAPVVRAYLAARWRASAIAADLDDAVQDAMLECFRSGGLLERADESRPGGFRAFLYGAVRNVARQHEARRASGKERVAAESVDLDALTLDEDSWSVVFDRAWAQAIMREAAERQAVRARAQGDAAMRRLEILRLRFQDGMPIREIAVRLGVDAARVHHEYARARDEFKEALMDVMRFYHPGAPEAAQREAAELVALLE